MVRNVASEKECVLIILSDCDGVLLDWEFGFDQWMQRQGFKKVRSDVYNICLRYDIDNVLSKKLVRQFNESAACGFLPPLRDAVKYVRKLYEEHGVRIRVITSLSLDPAAVRLREQNLNRAFGEAIESVICLECGADKDEALAPYKDSEMFWVEDKPENAKVGAELGLRAILMEHEHNADYIDRDIHVVANWKEIYKYF
jgi:hypothetical protein